VIFKKSPLENERKLTQKKITNKKRIVMTMLRKESHFLKEKKKKGISHRKERASNRLLDHGERKPSRIII